MDKIVIQAEVAFVNLSNLARTISNDKLNGWYIKGNPNPFGIIGGPGGSRDFYSFKPNDGRDYDKISTEDGNYVYAENLIEAAIREKKEEVGY